MKRTDPVSKKLRLIESEIDSYYKSNPLIHLPFGTAAWYFMAFCEDKVFFDVIKNQRNTKEAELFAHDLVYHLKYPFFWLYSSCLKGGNPSQNYNDIYYKASIDLAELSDNYSHFESVFTYASRGYTELSIEDNTISANPDPLFPTQYDAYDWLVKPFRVEPKNVKVDITNLKDLSVKVNGSRFTYRLNPKIVKQAMGILQPINEVIYTLPDHWKFSKYSMGDFKKVSNCLLALAYIHFTARMAAAEQGCKGVGYSSSVYLLSKAELINRLIRYSGCIDNIVTNLVEDITYGARGIIKPDPAIQPLFKLNDDIFAIMPSIFIFSSLERNFTILLNKLPSERAIYSRLVEEKESLMRAWIIKSLTIPNIRYFNGNVTSDGNLYNIDLAIISDHEKVCLFLELKWFIAPAEARELIDKSEEIQKGISQLLSISCELRRNPTPFFEALKINVLYEQAFLVSSETSIGRGSDQHPDIPVVRNLHLVSKANSIGNLRELSCWLSSRNYLPKEGEHYDIVQYVVTVGKWSLKLNGIKVLIQDSFQ